MHLNTGHHHLRVPKLGGSAQTLLRERQNSDKLSLQPRVLHGGSAQTQSMKGGPTLCSGDDVSMRDPHCKVMLSGRTSHTRVESFSFFGPKLDRSGGYGDLAHMMLCNTLVLWGWSVSNPGVSSGGTSNSTILPQSYQTGHGHDLAGIALRPTSFLCPSKRWGRGEPGELVT